MKKRTLYSLVVSLTLFAVMFITCGLIGVTGNKDAYAETSKPETETFVMRSGASIKYSDPSGIRFTTYVNPEYYNGLVEDGKAFHFGTIYAPATAYSGSIDDFTHASEVENGVSDIKIDKDIYWGADTVNDVEYMTYNTVQLYSENARNNGYYGVKMMAKSYVWIDENGNGEEDAGEYTYVANGVVRSIAQVAASALADGNDSEYIDAIPQYALGSGSVTLNDIDYHKSGNNSLETGRANQDYIYLPSGGTADFSYTPALLHTGDYMTAASDYAVTYGSGNDSVFTVDGGTITAVGAGTASLTAGVGTRVVAPVTTVSVVSPASSTYNRSGLAVTYQFDDVSYYGDSHILTFDADYINGKIAEGYNSVQVTMTIPSNGGSGISVRLYIDNTENKIASADTMDTSVSGTYDLVSDKAYSVVFRQSVDTTLDMTVVLQFNKDVMAYKESNGAEIGYAYTTTENYLGELMTFTFNSVPNASFNRFYFNESFIAEKMAAGYNKVEFNIYTWGSKVADLYENTTQIGTMNSNGRDPFTCGEIALTENAYYYIRLYHNIGDESADITVTVQFIKPVYAYTESNNAKIEFTSTTTEDSSGELMTFTFNSVPSATYNRFYFDESFIAEKMAAGYDKVEFIVYTWGSKVAELYENTTQKGTLSTNGRDPFTCGEIALTENAYYYIRLYHNVGSPSANIAITVRFTSPAQRAFNILATASSYGNHYHGTFGGVSSSGNSVSVVAGKGAGSDHRGFTLTPAAIQAMYDLGFSAVTFTVNSPTGYIDIYNMTDPENCVIGTRANIVGGDNYFANGTITLNLANIVTDTAKAMASEGIKFVVTDGASWIAYTTNCTVTFSNITFTPV